jgi:hypothetical protein
VLAAIRSDFAAALAGYGDGEAGNRLLVGHDGTIELWVDQVRGLAFMGHNDVCWTVRDGRHVVRNDETRCRAYLGYSVGGDRLFSAEDAAHIVTRLCRGTLVATRESDVASFVNLFVREPMLRPDVELVMWVSAAERLASSHGREYFLTEIPGLSSAFDVLHDEIPPGAQFGDGLRPIGTATVPPAPSPANISPSGVGRHGTVTGRKPAAPIEPTLPRYQARVLARVLPTLANEVEALLTAPTGEDEASGTEIDAACTQLFDEHANELRAFLRERLLDRVLAAVQADADYPVDH